MDTIILVLQLLLIPNMFGDAEPIVTTPRGTILGSLFTSRLGKTIYGFRGLRYAKAPINELRFQPPQPPEEWSGTYNATQDAPTCPQSWDGFQPFSEDCLFLNVYTTKLPCKGENPKRPVIVHFHAGAFVAVTGRSNWAGPQYLLDEDVVLVTLNYRLGVLGFISTGEKEAPGNLGLKDQVQALRWVKENIAYFGGDPECVTIFGYSAGSASVILHMMSPMSKGLFHRAIAGSSSPLAQWPQKRQQLDLAKRTARIVGCPDTSATEILNCLKKVPADELGKSIGQLPEFGTDPILSWEPVIELDFGQTKFLTGNPVELAVKGEFQSVPLMTGITKDEFAYGASTLLANESLVDALNADFDKYAPIILEYERDTRNSHVISQGLRNYYFGDKRIDNSTYEGVAAMYEDGLTGFSVNRAAKLISAKSSKPVYYYEFSYQGRYSHIYKPGTEIPYGVVHHDDLIYLFYISTLFPKFTTSDPESKTVDKMIKIWANFARTGNPIPDSSPLLNNVSWEPFTQQNLKYMEIGDKLEMKTGLHEDRYQAWEKVFPLPTVE